MTDNDLASLDTIQQTIKDCTKKPEIYLSVQEQISQKLKNTTKDLYDLAFRRKSVKTSKSESLPELIVNGFDTEQIWQQLELENNEEFGRISLGEISKTLANKKSWILPLKLHCEQQQDGKESETSENDDNDIDKEIDKELSDNDRNKNEQAKSRTIKTKRRKRTTEVDDKFFKLDELDEYLNKEDKKEISGKKKNDDSSDEDNESIDLFNNFSGSDNDDEIEDLGDDAVKNEKSVKYADFFDSPQSGDEDEYSNENHNNNDKTDDGKEIDYDNEMDDDDDEFNDGDSEHEVEKRFKKELQKEKKKVKFNLLENTDESDSVDNSQSKDETNEDNSKTKSSLEARQERLNERIKILEHEAISEKPWQLKGETSAITRPQNSLLEEFVEFDSVSRPAPVMTEQTTLKLEDVIRKRIQDKAWDDVEKKFKPVETPMEYKKKLIMNQEKSKESLAQIYENEYIKQREALTTKEDEQDKQEPPEHIEIREQMYSLFRKLDALSNFHYTPKPAKPEIKIVSNVAAINMEEVAPVATSDAMLLAPEEVKSKHKGELIGKSERTKTDMKRARRKKKLNQHSRALNESKKLVNNIKQKKSLKNAVASEKLKGRNIIVDETSTKNDGRSIKSSTAFFTQLQDQVESSIKAKTSTKVSKKSKNTISAVKLKL